MVAALGFRFPNPVFFSIRVLFLDRTRNRIETEKTLEIERVQDTYKLWAVLLPPILPLLIAVFVFITRRLQEKEGVARSRLR